MKFAQYDKLEQWCKENNVSFNVQHHEDCHVLSVAWYLDPVPSSQLNRPANIPVVWGLIKYPHAGGKYDVRPWGNRGKVSEFIELFDEMRRKAPIQPTQEIGAFH